MRHRDPFNDVESAIVLSLAHGRDNGILLIDNDGNPLTVQLPNIHEKMARDPEGWPTYYEEETPAVGIYTSGKDRDNESAVGLSILPIDVVMDVVVIGGDVNKIDTQMKQLIGCIDQYFRELCAQKVSDAPGGITGIATVYSVGRSLTNPPYQGERNWIAEGATSLHVQVRTES